MTAPLKHSDSVIVDVALGDRTYDIVIGRDVLRSLGGRVAALRPGARTAIVTDRTVAKHWLEQTEASLSQAGDWSGLQALSLHWARLEPDASEPMRQLGVALERQDRDGNEEERLEEVRE